MTEENEDQFNAYKYFYSNFEPGTLKIKCPF